MAHGGAACRFVVLVAGYPRRMTASRPPTDVITFLTEQHREVADVFAQLEDMDGATDEKPQRLAEQVVTSLVKHSVAEVAARWSRPKSSLRRGRTRPHRLRVAPSARWPPVPGWSTGYETRCRAAAANR